MQPAGATARTPQDTPGTDTVSRRIGRVSAGVVLTVLVFGTGATMALLHSSNQVDRFSSGYGPAGDANAAALTYMLDAETGIRGYALTGATSSLAPYRRAVDKVLPAIDSVRAALHSVGDTSLDAETATEHERAEAWITRVARPAVRGELAARRETHTATARVLFDAFRRSNATVTRRLDQIRRGLRSDTQNLSRWVLPLVVTVAALVLLVSGLFAFRTARWVSAPLAALAGVVRRLEDGDLSARADQDAGPAEVRAASAAVNRLAADRSRVREQQRYDDRLRTEVRDLTSAIRIGQDAQTIARTLVAGLGRVFGLDVVWLITFDDGRVPDLTARWRRSDDAHPDEDEPGGADLVLYALANRLWHAGTVVGISDHRAAHSAVDDDAPDPISSARIRVPPQVGAARASAIVAIGEGNSALGMMWLATTDHPRVWTTTELGLFQHVAAELAQSLVQNHVLAQQRAAMRRLREADEAKSALVSTVSHELRTPLTSIIGYLDVLLDTYGEDLDTEITDMLHVVERNATRLRSMIEDLLKQTERESGRRLGALDRTDLSLVLDDVGQTVRPLAANAQLELEIRPPDPGSVVVDGDVRELTQALINLAANAVKFTRPGGRVTISAGRDGDSAEIRVSDTGIGIAADEIPHLFERFFRARNARSAAIPGTGLGLAIVADIVARHGGKVDVQSTPGVGTSFVIRIPSAST